MTAQSVTRIRKPLKGSKTEAILTLTTTTPATPVEIAESVNTSRQLVHDVLKRYGVTPNDIDSMKNHRISLIRGKQAKILENLDDTRLKKASANNLAYAFTQLYQMERLESGQATALIGHGVGLSAPLQEAVDKLVGRAKPVDNSQIVDVNEINPLNNVVKSVT